MRYLITESMMISCSSSWNRTSMISSGIWTSEVEKRDVYLTAKKTWGTSEWRKVEREWPIEDTDLYGLSQCSRVDMDTIMDYIIDPVAGSPSRTLRSVNGNVCMHVDDLNLHRQYGRLFVDPIC